MSTPASKLPLGLLDLLGIKSLGAYPQFLRQDFQPVFEMLDMLHATQQEGEADNVLAPAGLNYNASSVVVPQNELWYVPALAFTVIGVTGVGEALNFSGAMSQQQTVSRVLTGLRALGASQQGSVNNNSPVWAPPGTSFGLQADLLTGTPSAVVRVVPVKMLL